MTSPISYLVLNSSGSTVGAGVSPDGTLPKANATFSYVACTSTQAQNWSLCTVADGVVTLGEPALSAVQAVQSAAMRTACQAAITAGFTSSALGAVDNYPSDQTTQSNIALAAISGGALWCQPNNGEWALTAHTAVQAQQVQKDLAAHIQAQQATYAGLLADIAAATTVAAVQAIAWP
ncbi:MAG TPA: hypothetical protein VL356_02570 [Acidocella sp.]|nr:hypothetical protein [Acidocella sp.]